MGQGWGGSDRLCHRSLVLRHPLAGAPRWSCPFPRATFWGQQEQRWEAGAAGALHCSTSLPSTNRGQLHYSQMKRLQKEEQTSWKC